jgi:hypothetical protein
MRAAARRSRSRRSGPGETAPPAAEDPGPTVLGERRPIGGILYKQQLATWERSLHASRGDWPLSQPADIRFITFNVLADFLQARGVPG